MSESGSSDHAQDFVLVDRNDAQDPDLKRIKIWLKPTDSDSPASEYRKHLHSHAAGTGEWILETEQYRDWSQSDSVGNLWIRGIPGCGKSVVAATLTSRLQRLESPPVPVLFFFFREIIQTNRSPQSLVQDFCHKLIDHSPLLQATLKKLREDFPDELPFDRLWEALSTAMQAMKKIYCVVDALDEMELGQDQWLENFLNLGRQFPQSIKTIVTSRQVSHVEKHMFKTHLVDLRLDRRRVDRDISIYVSKRLENSELDLSPSDAEMIRTAICERGNGLFLYARLMLDELLRSPEDLQSRVHNLPHGLGDMYSDILREHAASSGISSDLQRLILEWITHSARPLRLLELAAMIEASPGRIYFGSDVKLAIKTSCGPLLEICEDGVIQIIHHSLTEFILNRDVEHIVMNNQNREFAVVDSQAVHRKIAHTCIDYLTSGCFQNWELTEYRNHEPQERQSLYLQFYFLRYATLEWPFHVAKAGDDMELLAKLGEFCQDGNHDYEAWNDIWRAGQGEDVPQRCSPLHVAAYTGLSSLAQYLLSQGADPDSKDDDGRTPMMYAVMKNHDQVVSILLQNNASRGEVVTGAYGTRKHSLLYYACKLNHTPVVRALISEGLDPMAKENEFRSSGTTFCEIVEKDLTYSLRFQISALGCACQNGHVEAVRELMKHVSPVDLCAGNLHLAARAGKAETVAALLENEHVRLTVNDRDSDGNTPLYLAACIRSASTIQVLLDHGADITVRSLNRNSPPEPPVGMDPRLNFEASPSYTPLHGWAIGFPRDKSEFLEGQDMKPTLDLLLQAGCDINAKDYRGRTTLFKWPHPHWADIFADEFIATLLDRGADATVVDDEGQTPLHSLQGRPFEKTLRLLVNAGVDINAQRKKDGLTALMCTALQQNHTDPAVFHKLKADFDLQDWEGNTAFHHYFRRSPAGKDCHLNTWLSLSNLQMQNNLGRTPLHEYMYRQGGCVDMEGKKLQPLLEMVKRGVSLETKDGLGRTALLIALMGTGGISLQFVEELLRLGANVQAIDYRGKSALHYAFKPFRKHYVSKDETLDVIRCLIKAGANVHSVDHEGNTVFNDMIGHEPTNSYDNWVCIENRAREAIEMGVPYQQANYKGRNALHVAAAIGNDHGYDVTKKVMTRLEFLLQPNMPFNVNARDNEGVTPLHVASAVSDTNSLMLIENGADVQAKDRLGRSPLHLAARAGQSNVVGLLTEIYRQGSIDIDQRCTEKRSALHQAARSGNSEAVRLLLQAGANASLADRLGRTPLHAAAEFQVRTRAQRIQTQIESMPTAPEPRKRFSKSKPKDAFSRMELIVSDEDDARCIQEIIRLLLAAGANLGQVDANGHRPLDVAVMLGCSPAVDELKLSMDDLQSQSLDPIGESLLTVTEYRVRALIESTQIPEDCTRFFERVFSTGNERLAEAFVRNQPMKLDSEEKSPLRLLARWGFTSMMTKLLPYVEDLGGLVPSLLKHAAKRSLSNLAMLGLLVKHLPENDKTALSTLLGEFSGGLRWWHPHALSLLLEAGADPNVSLKDGLNPLLISLDPHREKDGGNRRYKWSNKTIDILLKHGADPNVVPVTGWLTPLAAAIRGRCCVEAIQLLISHGAEVNVEGYSLVNTAIDLDSHDALEVLLKAGANPNGHSDRIPLVNAAGRWDRAEPAMRLLLQYGADPLHPTEDGSSTAFHELCRENRPIQLILETSVDLNVADGSGCTPLIKATNTYWQTNTRLAAMDLIEAGADVHAVDHTGSSALHYAASWGNLEVFQALLNKSVPLSARNNEGFTPLTTALKSYSSPKSSYRKEVCTMINFLLDQGADPLSTLPDGRTALHCIAGILMNYSNVDPEEQIEWDEGEDHFTAASQLYQRFLDAGCDREARDNEGNTPIFIYATGPKSDIRSNEPPPRPSNPEDYKKMFSEHDVHTTNYNGDSLLHAIARREEWICDADEGEGLFSALVELGLSPWKENNSGQTALDIAAAHEKQEILALFARDD